MCFTILKFKRVISWDSVGDIRVLKHHQFRSVFLAIRTSAINVNVIRSEDFLLDRLAPNQGKRATQKNDYGFHIPQYRELSAKRAHPHLSVNKLQASKPKTGDRIAAISRLVPGAGQFSNSLNANLDEFKALKESLQREGIVDETWGTLVLPRNGATSTLPFRH